MAAALKKSDKVAAAAAAATGPLRQIRDLPRAPKLFDRSNWQAAQMLVGKWPQELGAPPQEMPRWPRW